MKEWILNFFSNDKDPSNAEKNQLLNKLVITIGLFATVVLILFLFDDTDNNQEKKIGDFKIVDEDKAVKTRWIGEASTEVTSTKSKVLQLQRENKELKEKLEFLAKSLSDLKKELRNPQSTQVQQTKDTSPATQKDTNDSNLYKNFPLPPQRPEDYGVNQFGKVPKLQKKIIVKKTEIKDALGYRKVAEPEKEPPKPKEVKPLKILSTGTITKAVLLGGMDAPTMSKAKTNPLPVLLKVTDLSFLPNEYRYNIDGCFILGEGYGDLSSERAYIRTTTLSCITKDGYHIDTDFKGAIYGEDGKIGLRGRVVTKQGALLARTIVAGFLQGVSEAFQQSNTIVSVSPQGTTQTVDPNKAFQAGVYGGFAKSSEKLADFYLKMADQIYPVIEISAGRFVDVINTAPIKLKSLEEIEKEKGKK